MPQILKGAPVAKAIRENCRKEAEQRTREGHQPTLCILRVGERPDDVYYENSAVKKCGTVGIRADVRHLPERATTEELLEEIARINTDDSIHGLLMLRPLPKHLDEARIKEALASEKDVDCMLDANLFRALSSDEGGFLPCTAEAVVRLLEYYGIEIAGKEVVVIGRSMVVGRPLSMMLLGRNATVTVCHTKTQDLAGVCRRADVLVCAAGSPKMVDGSFVKPGAVVVDVGINQDADGNLVGDVDFDDASPVAGAITPVPGGIGSVTSWLLMEHLMRACASQLEQKVEG